MTATCPYCGAECEVVDAERHIDHAIRSDSGASVQFVDVKVLLTRHECEWPT